MVGIRILVEEGLGHSSYRIDLGDGAAAILDPPRFRLWRDAGFAVGALLAGFLADLVSIEAAIYAVAALSAPSGIVLIVRMYESHPPVPTGGD